MKSVAITGASRGIGRAIAIHFAENDYMVFVGARSKIDGIPAELERNIHYVRMDASIPEGHEVLVAKALEISGKLDVYVNNAGFSEWRPIEKIDQSFLQDIFSLNLFGYFWGCKFASANMNDGGVIINVSSLAARRGTPNNSAYVATKFGVAGLTQSLAKELGSRGIRVNAVCPVLVDTPGLIEALKKEGAPGFNGVEEFLRGFALSQTALGALPKEQDIAELCLFLASNSAKSITGQSINVDCGTLPN